MKVYLMRHASPDWHRTDIPYHIPPGPPLVEKGLAEADRLGKYLLEQRVRLLYTSPLERCNQTAEIAAGVCGAKVIVDPDLIEWQPEEVTRMVQARIWPVFERALAYVGDGQVGLMTHGGPVAAMLEALGMPNEELLAQRRFDHANPVPPAGVWTATCDGTAGEWEFKLDFVP